MYFCNRGDARGRNQQVVISKIVGFLVLSFVRKFTQPPLHNLLPCLHSGMPPPELPCVVVLKGSHIRDDVHMTSALTGGGDQQFLT